MDAAYKRQSRRSHPNLQHLSLAPLTPQYPLPPTVDDDFSLSLTRSTSYLAPKSLPQTPSILSRSSSRTRLQPRFSKSTHTLGALSSQLGDPLFLSKTSASMISHPHRLSSKPPSTTTTTSNESTDWLLQTASALTINTAESKGQSWLATRTSSTSLVETPYEAFESGYSYGGRRRASGGEADDEFSPISTRHGSRPVSRFASAWNSRRGSKVGLMTPMGIRTPGEKDEEEKEGFFEDMGPDFVDVEELNEAEEDVDEGEMRRLIKARVGGWWDYAVGWVDFRGEGEEELGEEEGEERQEGKEIEDKGVEGKKRRRRRDEKDRIVVASREGEELDVPPPEGGGVWKDAAWLLSVATKALV